MKKGALILLLLLPAVFATELTIEAPTTVLPGQTFDVEIILTGETFGVELDVTSDLTYNSHETTIDGLTSVAQNDNTVSFASIATQEIESGTLYTLSYTAETEGEYEINIQNLFLSNLQGNEISSTSTNAVVLVEDVGTTGLSLPSVSVKKGKTVDVELCVTNTRLNELKEVGVTVNHNPNIVKVTNVNLLQGTGTPKIENGKTVLDATGASILNSDCEQNTGVKIARITYQGLNKGTTKLSFTTATLADISGTNVVQNNDEGQITVTQTTSGSGSSSGSGGGGGGVKNTCYPCTSNNYQCCTPTRQLATQFCNKPEAHSFYCKQTSTPKTTKATPIVAPPMFNLPITPQTTPEVKKEQPKELPKTTAASTTETTTTIKKEENKETKKEEIPVQTEMDQNLVTWIVGALAVILFGISGFLMAKGKMHHKPKKVKPTGQSLELPEPPRETPSTPALKKHREETKVETEVNVEDYAAQIRERLRKL
jgi:hypothetical protein